MSNECTIYIQGKDFRANALDHCNCDCFKESSADPRWFRRYYITNRINKPKEYYCIKCGHTLDLSKKPDFYKMLETESANYYIVAKPKIRKPEGAIIKPKAGI